MKPENLVPYLPISPYVEVPADLQDPLSEDVHADVAILGGGFTGLSTALALKDRGVNAVVVERDFCGFGSSGRNAGHLTPTICKDLPTAILLFGRKETGNLVRFADHCVETTENLIRLLGIDCDYNASGNILSVVHPAQERRLRKASEIAKSVGAKVHFCEPAEMRERGIPGAFLSGAMEEKGGTLHPGKLVMGLRGALIRAGVRIHEQSRVLQVVPGKQVKLICEKGSITADRLVVATNAYTTDIGKPGNRLAPLLVTLFESAPLSDGQLAALGGWTNREGIYTAHECMESYRLTARRTIIGGSKGVQYFYGGKTANHARAETAATQAVVNAFRDRFPALETLPVQHVWTGWIAMTTNFLPVVGPLEGHPNIYHSVGYNGHGVAQAVSLGAVLADALVGTRNEWQDIIFRKPVFMPPEPIRWLFAHTLLAILNGVDRYMDKRIPRLGQEFPRG